MDSTLAPEVAPSASSPFAGGDDPGWAAQFAVGVWGGVHLGG